VWGISWHTTYMNKAPDKNKFIPHFIDQSVSYCFNIK